MDATHKNAYMIQYWNSPGFEIPEKLKAPVFIHMTARYAEGEPTISVHCVQSANNFSLVSEQLEWWRIHRALVSITALASDGAGNISGEFIGRYHVDVVRKNNTTYEWWATFRILGNYRNKLPLSATMAKALTEKMANLDVVGQRIGTQITSDDESVTTTLENASGKAMIREVFRGVESPALYESIGRIEMALLYLEGAMCVYVGHIADRQPNGRTDCPERMTFGTHHDLLNKMHDDCLCPESSELHRAKDLIGNKIKAWRNSFAHGSPALDALPYPSDMVCADKGIITLEHDIAAPIRLIRIDGVDIELTPAELNEIEREVIEAWSIIECFNLNIDGRFGKDGKCLKN